MIQVMTLSTSSLAFVPAMVAISPNQVVTVFHVSSSQVPTRPGSSENQVVTVSIISVVFVTAVVLMASHCSPNQPVNVAHMDWMPSHRPRTMFVPISMNRPEGEAIRRNRITGSTSHLANCSSIHIPAAVKALFTPSRTPVTMFVPISVQVSPSTLNTSLMKNLKPSARVEFSRPSQNEVVRPFHSSPAISPQVSPSTSNRSRTKRLVVSFSPSQESSPALKLVLKPDHQSAMICDQVSPSTLKVSFTRPWVSSFGAAQEEMPDFRDDLKPDHMLLRISPHVSPSTLNRSRKKACVCGLAPAQDLKPEASADLRPDHMFEVISPQVSPSTLNRSRKNAWVLGFDLRASAPARSMAPIRPVSMSVVISFQVSPSTLNVSRTHCFVVSFSPGALLMKFQALLMPSDHCWPRSSQISPQVSPSRPNRSRIHFLVVSFSPSQETRNLSQASATPSKKSSKNLAVAVSSRSQSSAMRNSSEISSNSPPRVSIQPARVSMAPMTLFRSSRAAEVSIASQASPIPQMRSFVFRMNSSTSSKNVCSAVCPSADFSHSSKRPVVSASHSRKVPPAPEVAAAKTVSRIDLMLDREVHRFSAAVQASSIHSEILFCPRSLVVKSTNRSIIRSSPSASFSPWGRTAVNSPSRPMSMLFMARPKVSTTPGRRSPRTRNISLIGPDSTSSRKWSMTSPMASPTPSRIGVSDSRRKPASPPRESRTPGRTSRRMASCSSFQALIRGSILAFTASEASSQAVNITTMAPMAAATPSSRGPKATSPAARALTRAPATARIDPASIVIRENRTGTAKDSPIMVPSSPTSIGPAAARGARRRAIAALTLPISGASLRKASAAPAIRSTTPVNTSVKISGSRETLRTTEPMKLRKLLREPRPNITPRMSGVRSICRFIRRRFRVRSVAPSELRS